jgi:hypothetical protein
MYDCDLAGPIATIIAAVAAVSVTAYFAWHQKRIAEKQADIASEKLRHDLYERRYRVFDAVRKLLLEIARDRNASKDGLRAFLIATGEAVFLFDDDVTKHVEGIRDRAEELQSLNCDIDSKPADEPNPDAVKQRNEHVKWILSEVDPSVDKFKPYLKLKDFSPSRSAQSPYP